MTNIKEVVLVGVFGYWCSHIVHVGILMAFVYWVTRKAASLEWRPSNGPP